MSTARSHKSHYTFEEYIALEKAQGIRYEFDNGEIYAMAGATKRHNTIVQNITFALRPFARKNGCQTFSENVKQKLQDGERYVYPDVIYTCDSEDLADDSDVIVSSPCLLIEVLSDSTEDSDKMEKRQHYFKLPSLQCYLLVAQQSCIIEVYQRANDFWKFQSHTALNAQIYLEALDVRLSVADIYEGVMFS